MLRTISDKFVTTSTWVIPLQYEWYQSRATEDGFKPRRCSSASDTSWSDQKNLLQFERCCDVSATKLVLWLFRSFLYSGCFSTRERVFSFSPRRLGEFLSVECECFLNRYKRCVLLANISFSPLHYFFSPDANYLTRFPLSLMFWRCGVFGLYGKAKQSRLVYRRLC